MALIGILLIGAALWFRSSEPLRNYLYRAKDVAELERLVESSPRDATARYYLAKAYYLKREFSEAVPHYEEAAALSPRSARAHLGLGLARFEIGDDAGAASALERAIELDPKSAWGHYILGKLAWRAGDLDLAQRYTWEAAQLDPRSDQAWYGYAACAAQRRQYKEAISALRKAVAQNPRNAPAHAALGELLVYRGQPGEGVEMLERALQIDPSNAAANVLLGKHLANNGSTSEAWKRAEQLLKKSLALRAPRPADTNLELGRLLSRLNRHKEAVAHLEDSRVLDPRDERVYYALANSYRRLGLNDHADRVNAQFKKLSARHVRQQQLEARVHHKPSDFLARLELARLYRDQGLVSRAADQYSRYIQLQPDDERARLEIRQLVTNASESGGLTREFSFTASPFQHP